MSHEFSIGDIVRMNGTQQEAEVLELSEDEFRGELLRVKLKGVPLPSIIFVFPQLVELVQPAAPEQTKNKKILT